MIRYWCALPFNLNSNVIMQTSYRIYEKQRSQICIFNNPLQFVEIKAVLEGWGFRPKILGKVRGPAHPTIYVMRLYSCAPYD